MIADSVGPFSRPVAVTSLPQEGRQVRVSATPEECEALRTDLGLGGLRRLEARFRLAWAHGRLGVTGRITADITQTCVVTLDPFDSILDEDVEVQFVEAAPPRRNATVEQEVEIDPDAPDEIVDGRVDLGSIASEFLALGLDPYPKKPGVAFASDAEGEPADSPFAVLGRRHAGPDADA